MISPKLAFDKISYPREAFLDKNNNILNKSNIHFNNFGEKIDKSDERHKMRIFNDEDDEMNNTKDNKNLLNSSAFNTIKLEKNPTIIEIERINEVILPVLPETTNFNNIKRF